MAVFAILVAFLMVTTPPIDTSDTFNLQPADDTFLYEPCLKGEKKGLCLYDYQCLSNSTMSIGGEIIVPELRNCGPDLWCCTYPKEDLKQNTKPVTPQTPSSEGTFASLCLEGHEKGICIHNVMCTEDYVNNLGGSVNSYINSSFNSSTTPVPCDISLYCCTDSNSKQLHPTTAPPLTTLKPNSSSETVSKGTFASLCLEGHEKGICIYNVMCTEDYVNNLGGSVNSYINSSFNSSTTPVPCDTPLLCCTDSNSEQLHPTPAPPLTTLKPTSSTETDSKGTYGTLCLDGHEKGICIYKKMCTEDYVNYLGGSVNSYINSSFISITTLGSCDISYFCCTDSNFGQLHPTSEPPLTALKPETSTNTVLKGDDGKCSRVLDECTWCVALYREEGDVSRGQVSESGLYCGGALVGSRVVLTAATCVITVRVETVRARLLNSEKPDKLYTVIDTLSHSKYDSATHQNDFALLLLDEDVKWSSHFNRGGGACMKTNSEIQGSECQTIGFSIDEEIVMSPVSMHNGPCRDKRGDGFGSEVACGTATRNVCHAVTGFPLLCPVEDAKGGMAIAGVVRFHCEDDKVLLGKVQQQRTWLNSSLRNWGVKPSLYRP